MRTKKSAYTAPAPKAKTNGTKSSKYAPVQQFSLTNDMVNVQSEEEEEFASPEMLAYQDNEEDPDFDPDEDEAPKKKRGRPARNSVASNNNTPNKRGRKPTPKAAEAAANAAAKAATNSPAKKALPTLTPAPVPPPAVPVSPKKRGRQPKAADTADSAAAGPGRTVSPGGVPGVNIPVAAVGTPVATVPTPGATPVANSAPRYNYLKPIQPPVGGGISEARLKEVEAQCALDLQKSTRNFNMIVANLREEFAAKLVAMKAEWDSERTKIWETLGRAQVKKEVGKEKET